MFKFNFFESKKDTPAQESYDVAAMRKFLDGLENNPNKFAAFKSVQEGRARDIFKRGELKNFIEPGQKVLYVGMGAGYVAQHIQNETGADMVKFDIADLRTPDNKDNKFFVASARHLPIKSESCDVVLLSDVLHHCTDQEEIMAEVIGALRQQGKLILLEDTVPESTEKTRQIMAGLTAKMDDLLNQQPSGVNPHGYRSIGEWQSLADDMNLSLDDEKHWYWGPVDFLPAKLQPDGGQARSLGRPFESTRFVFVKQAADSSQSS